MPLLLNDFGKLDARQTRFIHPATGSARGWSAGPARTRTGFQRAWPEIGAPRKGTASAPPTAHLSPPPLRPPPLCRTTSPVVKCFDLTLPSPAENLACEEALLDCCEASGGDEILRFWEPAQPFVVVGYANAVANEVNADACRDAGVPIFRRCSGGGTVLQGPGCLNYAVILRTSETGPLATISATNRFVMERNRRALQSLLPAPVLIQGHTDLTLGPLKFSGNSQRRRHRWLLFHGTFLLQFDLDLIERCLAMPSHQPDYRAHRRHRDFLTCLGLAAETVKAALRQAWDASLAVPELPGERLEALVNRYKSRAWNFRF
jgi:lipoate-protein ligase A